MSIIKLRHDLIAMKVAGAERLTMQYDQGGKIEVFSIDQTKVRLGPNSSAVDIRDALAKV